MLDGERHGGIVEADDHVDFLGVEPLPGDRGPDIGFVLVVGEYHFDRLAEHGAAGVGDGHTRRDDGTRAAEIGVES